MFEDNSNMVRYIVADMYNNFAAEHKDNNDFWNKAIDIRTRHNFKRLIAVQSLFNKYVKKVDYSDRNIKSVLDGAIKFYQANSGEVEGCILDFIWLFLCWQINPKLFSLKKTFSWYRSFIQFKDDIVMACVIVVSVSFILYMMIKVIGG